MARNTDNAMRDWFQVVPGGIAWDVTWPTGIPHADHVEMGGRQV
jgi:hypothetical protein